ncbi:Protein of unknown function [Cotesia congregata]|uniref:Uncharacterized protein n=1 Tax=Cotesia congregata TaxID=51543 RepID=A0A8J2MEP2_COTCN|nr:Protein of unknown function [Cotesia congregata]
MPQADASRNGIVKNFPNRSKLFLVLRHDLISRVFPINHRRVFAGASRTSPGSNGIIRRRRPGLLLLTTWNSSSPGIFLYMLRIVCCMYNKHSWFGARSRRLLDNLRFFPQLNNNCSAKSIKL